MTSSPPAPLRILVVASEAAAREAVTVPLRELTYEVLCAEDSAAAMRLAASRPDVIVVDHQLTDLSGADLCRRLKTQPATALIPILQLVPADSAPLASASGLGAGADGFLSHPIDVERLAVAIGALAAHERLSQVQEPPPDSAIGS